MSRKNPKRSRSNQNRKQSQRQTPGNEIEVEIVGMAHGGSGLGKYRGRTVLVPYTIPGERVQGKIVHSSKQVDFVEGTRLQVASQDRVIPPCPHFGQGACWGCQWQHIDYSVQLLLKQEVLGEQLVRLGHFSEKAILNVWQSTIPSPQQWNYNEHVTFEIREDGRLGFFRADHKTIEPIDECLVSHPDLLPLLETLEFDPEGVSKVRLQRGSDGNAMLVFWTSGDTLPEVAADFPVSVNAILPSNEPLNLVGEPWVNYVVAERNFRVTAGSFIRPNVQQVPALIGEILRILQLEGREQVLEMYGGVGIFTAFIAPRVENLTMVESYPPAANDAEANLDAFDNVDLVEGSVLEVLESILEEESHYDVAIMDPPGFGLGKDVITLLSKVGIPRLIYVSSDPASLAKDAAQLVRSGFQLSHLQPIDFAPQTYYISSVAVFERK